METKHFLLAAATLTSLFTVVRPAFAQTWRQTSAPLTNWACVACSADGTRLIAAVGSPGGPVFVSTNAGTTWSATSAPITNWSALACSADGSKLLASGASGTYTSDDFGATWRSNDVPAAASVASSADGTRLVLATTSGFVGPVYISSDSGASWFGAGIGAASVASSADGTKLVGGSYGDILTSTNSGATWTYNYENTGAANWISIASSADGTRLAAATPRTYYGFSPGTIITSTNSGSNWTFSISGATFVSVASSADGTRLVAVAGDAGPIYTSEDSGASWTAASAPSTNRVSVAASADGHRLVAVANGGGIYISQNSVAPWLNLSHSDGQVVISWLVPSMEFVLQQNPDLSTSNWTDVTNTPTFNFTNLQNQVILSVANTNCFYRLKH